jgi:hypothetical protein
MAQTNTAQTIPFPDREVFGIPPADHHRLQPLLFLPDQFFTAGQQTTAMRSGERRLMFAVLQDAVARWFRYRHARTDSGREAFCEIRDWFWDTDQEWLFGFESICFHLDLNAEYFRRKLMRWDTLNPQSAEPEAWDSPYKLTRRAKEVKLPGCSKA